MLVLRLHLLWWSFAVIAAILLDSCFQWPVGTRQPDLVPVSDCSSPLEGESEPLELVRPSAPLEILQQWVRHQPPWLLPLLFWKRLPAAPNLHLTINLWKISAECFSGILHWFYHRIWWCYRVLSELFVFFICRKSSLPSFPWYKFWNPGNAPCNYPCTIHALFARSMKSTAMSYHTIILHTPMVLIGVYFNNVDH